MKLKPHTFEASDLSPPQAVNACWYLLTMALAGHHSCECFYCRAARECARKCLAIMENTCEQTTKHFWPAIAIGPAAVIFLSNCERSVIGGVKMLFACATLT